MLRITLAFLLAALPLRAQTIVNINARTNAANNPVQITLQAGTYVVVPITTANGGLYTAWSTHLSWANSWLHRYTVSSTAFPTMQPGVLQGYKSTPAHAFQFAVSCTFTLAVTTVVNFSVCDGPGCYAYAGDNTGGVSLAISTTQKGQPNSPSASLVINDTGTYNTHGPFPVSIQTTATVTLSWSGPASMPFILAAGNTRSAALDIGCPGFLDLDSRLVFVLDGLSSPTHALNGGGTAQQVYQLANLPLGASLNLQGAVLQPTAASCPIVLTAAFHLTVR